MMMSLVDYLNITIELLPYQGSRSVDQKSLTVIAATLAKDKTTSANAKVESLLARTSDPKTKQCLESCGSVYEDLLSDLNTSILAIKEDRPVNAKTYLSIAMDALDTCEDGFKELNVLLPLNKEDSDLTQMCTIALAFTNMLG
ncbi:hypothetical protein C4D60_Mb00t00320 [Musa balbisiana]|uniref:Pectinesterase inhibitor domain-containing protein n=1 Tax=Musa balbisiana TaxID=52838 RepID=A0A4S8I5Y3_MUSBA|nr:hypothetical protein C4D60_Mb00t00320 [Musa balbisiana]